jgi:hypothetical protein
LNNAGKVLFDWIAYVKIRQSEDNMTEKEVIDSMTIDEKLKFLHQKSMDKFSIAVEALKAAKEEMGKMGIVLSWELIAVSRDSFIKGQTWV